MSVDKTLGLSLEEGSDYPCAERQAPSIFYSLCFMLLPAEKLGQWVLRTKAFPGAGRLVLATAGDTLMVPMKAPIVQSQFLPPNTMKQPAVEQGQAAEPFACFKTSACS